MKKISETERNEIKTLRADGASYKEISKKLNVGVGTSYKYAKDVSLSDKAKQKLTRKIKENRNRFAERFAEQKNIKVLHGELTSQKTRIVSHCLWDGSVSGYTVRYNSTSTPLIGRFVDDMREAYGILPDKVREREDAGRLKLYTAEYCSKKISDDLHEYTSTYSTKDSQCSIPVGVMKSRDRELIQEFLKSFWEDEGSISHDGLIRAKIRNGKIRDQLRELHSKLDIDVFPYEEKSDETSGVYVLNNRENIRKFADVSFERSFVTRGKNKGKLKFEVFNSLYKKHLSP